MNTMSGPEHFQRETGVSRETCERLVRYAAVLGKWNPSINLVSASTLSQIWSRHFLDSAQILALCGPAEGLWADLGSGGGFPGLVIAILAAETAPGLAVTLVESDARKAAFLATVLRETGARASILAARSQDISPLNARFLSARALAPLPQLLAHAARHLAPDGRAYFPKGARWRQELAAARQNWAFDAVAHPSKTDRSAVVLEIKGITRA